MYVPTYKVAAKKNRLIMLRCNEIFDRINISSDILIIMYKKLQ